MISEELLNKIRLIAPGTKLRKALDDIIRANFGALIFFTDDVSKHKDIIQGGFELNTTFSPEKLYELSKMDGAIVVNEDITRILYANVHLVPDASIPTTETGTRHRTAERVARQTGKMVIAVSRRRNIITLYYKSYKYVVNETSFLIIRVNQAISTLEKYRVNFDRFLSELDAMEFENRVTLQDVMKVIEKGLMILKIHEELKPYLIEIGDEGRLAIMQVNELIEDVDDIVELLIMDYANEEIDEKTAQGIIEKLIKEKEISQISIARAMRYDVQQSSQLSDISLSARGYRILKYVAKIPLNVSYNVVKTFKNIEAISKASLDQLKSVEGIGDKRAKAISEGISSLKYRKVQVTEQ
ncbi:MAG TPA: DNA integrity scanning protein DisA [Thermotoga sp.]|nr:DNA integrity scanning protein DisA [Thermotoga sp.]